MKTWISILVVGLAAIDNAVMAQCSGPNCTQGLSFTQPAFAPNSGLPALTSRTNCGCSTCDPRWPCSAGTCSSQNCQNIAPFQGQSGVSELQGGSGFLGQRQNDAYGTRPFAQNSSVGRQRLCPVTGAELGSMGPPIPVTVVGRTIYVCCQSCVAAVQRNPQEYLAKVQAELRGTVQERNWNPSSGGPRPSLIGPQDRQGNTPLAASSPQRLCPVTGEQLGSMGPPIPVTILGRTIYVCCNPCVAEVRREPEKYLSIVDQSVASESRFQRTAPATLQGWNGVRVQ